MALTVTPDVSIFQYRFASADQYEAVDLLMQETENSNVSWSDSTFSYLDPTTAEVTLSTADHSQRAYFYVKFSAPAVGHGTFTQDHARPGQGTITGDAAGGYLTFRPGTPVTVAVALSMTSMSTAERNFRRQFPAFGFTAAVAGLRQAWNAKLGRIDVTSATAATAEQVYTGLYTLYANIIDVTANSENYRPYRAEHQTAHHRLVGLVGAGRRRLLPVLLRSGPERLRVLDADRSVRHDRRAEHLPVAVRPGTAS